MKLNNVFLSLFGILLLLFLSQCCTSKEQAEDSQLALKRTNYPPRSISPGTAEVSATLIKLTQENSKIMGLFKIDTVHAYGPSTRPIGVGSRLNIEFSDNLLTDNQKNISEVFKPETKHKLTLSYSLSAFKRDHAPPWQVISIR
jgi:hypothetical protein